MSLRPGWEEMTRALETMGLAAVRERARAAAASGDEAAFEAFDVEIERLDEGLRLLVEAPERA